MTNALAKRIEVRVPTPVRSERKCPLEPKKFVEKSIEIFCILKENYWKIEMIMGISSNSATKSTTQ